MIRASYHVLSSCSGGDEEIFSKPFRNLLRNFFELNEKDGYSGKSC